MHKGIISTLIVCFLGAAIGVACDANTFTTRPFHVIPTLGAPDEPSSPGSCSEAETADACAAALTCVWSGDACEAMDFSAHP